MNKEQLATQLRKLQGRMAAPSTRTGLTTPVRPLHAAEPVPLAAWSSLTALNDRVHPRRPAAQSLGWTG